MAIEKSDPQVLSLNVRGDGSVTANVNYLLADGGTEITRATVDVIVTNSTSDERAAIASLRNKAAALAVA